MVIGTSDVVFTPYLAGRGRQPDAATPDVDEACDVRSAVPSADAAVDATEVSAVNARPALTRPATTVVAREATRCMGRSPRVGVDESQRGACSPGYGSRVRARCARSCEPTPCR